MEIIGVIDVRRGQAVHAVAGERERYAPVAAVAGVPVRGDATTLARAYVERLGVRELYVADLDAIVDDRPQPDVVTAIASCGAALWVDAGVGSLDAARFALAPGVVQVIVGLETLPSWRALAEIAETIGGDRVAFSLDLRNGKPLGRLSADERPASIAARAVEFGVATVIVLDLGRVGGGAGLDCELLAAVRDAAPNVRLAAGGGLRGREDLERLAAVGCDAALVATALHDGRVDGEAVLAARLRAHRSVSR